MVAKTLECPNCGAPLDHQGDSDDPTIRCPYCHTSVVVPEELRKREGAQPSVVVSYSGYQPRQGSANAGKLITWLLIIIFLIVVVSIAVPILGAVQITNSVLSEVREVQENMGGDLPKAVSTPTRTPTPTTVPTVTPTLAFANPQLTFGKAGIGPGMFEDARYIAVDGQGRVYVAEYSGGRIQVFDSNGKYLHQWQAGDEKTIFHGMAASYTGTVFVSSERDIVRYEGASGDELGRMRNSIGGEFGELYATADGGVAAIWYEQRWGMITSLQGHREDLVIFDKNGKTVRTVPSLVSGQTEELALDVYLAVNGEGTVYAMSDSTLFQFAPDGKFINRFGSRGKEAGQFDGAHALAVDGEGRVYVAGSNMIYVLSPEGLPVTFFPTSAHADAMAIDAEGRIWTVSRTSVTRYDLKAP